MGTDVEHVLAGRIMAAKGDLLTRLDIAVGTRLREVSHLRARTGCNDSKRHSAKYLLHLIDSKIDAGHLCRLLDTEH